MARCLHGSYLHTNGMLDSRLRDVASTVKLAREHNLLFDEYVHLAGVGSLYDGEFVLKTSLICHVALCSTFFALAVLMVATVAALSWIYEAKCGRAMQGHL